MLRRREWPFEKDSVRQARRASMSRPQNRWGQLYRIQVSLARRHRQCQDQNGFRFVFASDKHGTGRDVSARKKGAKACRRQGCSLG